MDSKTVASVNLVKMEIKKALKALKQLVLSTAIVLPSTKRGFPHCSSDNRHQEMSFKFIKRILRINQSTTQNGINGPFYICN